LTAAELKQHPEYPHVIWKLEPTLKGKFEVAKRRGGPFKLSWEVHGRGDRKIVVSNSTIVNIRFSNFNVEYPVIVV